ncbi:MAG: hypothetical protein AB1405_16245, partial [Bdellovibrionota bacterium]
MRRATVCWILFGLLAVPVPSFAFSLFHAPRFSLAQESDDEAPLGELPGQQLERETGDAVFSYAGGNAMGDSTFLRGHFEFGLSLYTKPADIEIIHLRFGGAQFDQDLNQGAEPYMSIGGRLRLYPARKPFGPKGGIVPYGVGGGSFGFEWGTEDEFFGQDKQDYFGLWEVGGGIEFYGFDERRRTLDLSTCLFVEATTYWVQGGKPPANFLPESREWNQGV